MFPVALTYFVLLVSNDDRVAAGTDRAIRTVVERRGPAIAATAGIASRAGRSSQ